MANRIIRRRSAEAQLEDGGLPPGWLTEEEVQAQSTWRGLVTGKSGCGKTTSVLLTCPKPAAVLNCDGPGQADPAIRNGAKQLYIRNIVSKDDWLREVDVAIRLAEMGRVRSIVVDTATMLINQILLLDYARREGLGDTFKLYRWMQVNGIDGLRAIMSQDKAHVFVIAHNKRAEGELEVEGALKATLPAMFSERLHLVYDKKRDPQRIFQVGNSSDAFSKSRAINSYHEVPADIGEVLELLGMKA